MNTLLYLFLSGGNLQSPTKVLRLSSNGVLRKARHLHLSTPPSILPSQAQLQQAKAEVWTSGVESATGGEKGDRTSPASQSEESVEEERILLSAPVPVPVTSTVPTKPVASASSASLSASCFHPTRTLGRRKKRKTL